MAESSAADFTVGKIQKDRGQRVAKMYGQQKRNIIHTSSTAYEQDHSAAAPPSSVMKSRRLIQSARRRTPAVSRNRRYGISASLELDLGLVDHLGPLLGFRHDELLKVARRHRHWHTAEVRKAYLDVRVGESGVYFFVELIDDFARCILGRPNALPSTGLEAWHRLCDGWYLWQRPRARRGGNRQRAHLAGFDGLDRFGQRAEPPLPLPADQVGERGRTTAIGHMEHVDMSHQLKQLAADMGHASAAARRHADRARVWFDVGDEFWARLC